MNPTLDEPGRRARWAGRILSGLAALFLIFDVTVKLLSSPEAVTATTELGFSEAQVPVLGVIELVCLALYLAPPTARWGLLAFAGYLGGAVATHLRLENPLLSHTLFPLYVAAMLGLGLWLRDPRLRAAFPLPALRAPSTPRDRSA